MRKSLLYLVALPVGLVLTFCLIAWAVNSHYQAEFRRGFGDDPEYQKAKLEDMIEASDALQRSGVSHQR